MAPHEVKELVDRVAAAYPDPGMSDETRELYRRMLSDLDYADADPVVDELIATTMRLPTISRIRRNVIEPKLGLPTAEEAWVAVQAHSPDMHELVRRTANLMGGSFNIRTSSDPELTRVRFAKVYDALNRREIDRALTATLRAGRMRTAQQDIPAPR
jgi:hypothetical protein